MSKKSQDSSSIANFFKKWKRLGPGIVTGAADDDPSGIATYSQTGAQYGLQLLWLSLLTLPLMYVVQEMCARLGMVTGKGIAENIRQYYSRPILFPIIILLFAANTFNIAADLAAMAASFRLIVPQINLITCVIAFTTLSTFLQVFTSYKTYSKYLKYLALVLISYVITGFKIKPDWAEVLSSTFIPSITFNKNQLILICAIFGTTISPYLFFWQTAQEIEEKIEKGSKPLKAKKNKSKKEMNTMRFDVLLGMFISNIIMFFIIVVCGSTLFKHGITDIKSAADAASALKPFAGPSAELIFTIGIIGTGLLSIPVLAGSSAYAVAEFFYLKEGLYKKCREAKGFYGVISLSMIIAIGIALSGINPIKALIYSAVANAILAPIVLFFIISMTKNPGIMGKFRNNVLKSSLGWVLLIIMSVSGFAAIIALFIK